MIKYILLAPFLLPFALLSQYIYGTQYITSSRLDANNVSRYYNQLTKMDSTNWYLESIDIMLEGSSALLDIAMSPDHVLYGIAEDAIYRIDWDARKAIKIRSHNLGPYANSLVCSADNELYTLVFQDLYKYNIAQDSIILVDHLGVSTPGDLTFYKGNLIFQTSIVDGEKSTIKAYNLMHKTLADVFCLDVYAGKSFGITHVYDHCKNGLLKAAYPYNGSGIAIDLLDQTIESSFFIGLTMNGYEVYGLTSDHESLESNCTNYVFKDLQCNALNGLQDQTFKTIIYPNPAKGQLYIESPFKTYTAALYTLDNQLVKEITGTDIRLVDVADLQTGIYYIKLLLENQQTLIKKIIIGK